MELKVCGLKYTDNIKQVAELDPEYIGFIFYEGSKRFVGNDFEMPVVSDKIKKVGVFVNASEEYVLNTAVRYKLDLVQLHGDESPDFCERIAKSIKVIKAFGVDENFDLSILNSYAAFCSHFLFDTKTDAYGGSGKPFDWLLLKDYKLDVPFFIAGGMDIEKIRKLNEMGLKVNGIDVNSKAEIKPGYKDIIKIIQIRNNIRK